MGRRRGLFGTWMVDVSSEIDGPQFDGELYMNMTSTSEIVGD
jgi:hypothetical protein